MRYSRAYVQAMQAAFPRLENFAHAKNRASLRWLAWCGFTIDSVPEEINGEDFYRFWRTRPQEGAEARSGAGCLCRGERDRAPARRSAGDRERPAGSGADRHPEAAELAGRTEKEIRRFIGRKVANPEARFAVMDIAMRHGLAKFDERLAAGRDVSSIRNWIAGVEEDGFTLCLDDAVVYGPGGDWREMPLAKFRDLAETTAQIRAVERNGRKLLAAWRHQVGATRAANDQSMFNYQKSQAGNKSGTMLGMAGTLLGGIGAGLGQYGAYKQTQGTKAGTGKFYDPALQQYVSSPVRH